SSTPGRDFGDKGCLATAVISVQSRVSFGLGGITMNENPITTGSAPLVDRAKSIILSPKTEWPKIATETDSVKDIFLKYAVPLAAIGPVASLIGGQLFGYGGMFGFSWKPSIGSASSMSITSYVLSLVSLFIVAWIANFLSPKFGGQESFEKAFRLCAYSFTAAW